MATAKWDAGLYDAKHAFVSAKGKDLVAQLAAKPGERILDLGCGTGTLTAEIAANSAEVLGIDYSAEMIGAAHTKFPQLRFEVCDARALPFFNEFDAVFSNAVLHWIPEAENVIEGVSRALKTNGRFVAEFGGKGNVHRLVVALESALTQLGISPDGANPWFYPSIAEYANILEKYGLEVREALLFERPTKLEDGERGFANFISMFGTSFLKCVPEASQPEYIRIAEHIARPQLWKTDHWELDYRRLRVEARKTALNAAGKPARNTAG